MPAIEKGKRGTNNTIIDIFGPDLPLPAISGRAIYRESKGKKHFAGGLFVVGFVNMIVPCPTAAVMYGYAINSGSMVTAIAVFGVYAISTVFAVGGGHLSLVYSIKDDNFLGSSSIGADDYASIRGCYRRLLRLWSVPLNIFVENTTYCFCKRRKHFLPGWHQLGWEASD